MWQDRILFRRRKEKERGMEKWSGEMVEECRRKEIREEKERGMEKVRGER